MDSSRPNTVGSALSQEITLQKVRRLTVTVGLLLCAGALLLGSLVCIVLLIVVPAMGLQNDEWARPENPITMTNALLYLAAGIACLFVASASDRVRFLTGLAVFLVAILYGLWDIGLLS